MSHFIPNQLAWIGLRPVCCYYDVFHSLLKFVTTSPLAWPSYLLFAIFVLKYSFFQFEIISKNRTKLELRVAERSCFLLNYVFIYKKLYYQLLRLYKSASAHSRQSTLLPCSYHSPVRPPIGLSSS